MIGEGPLAGDPGAGGAEPRPARDAARARAARGARGRAGRRVRHRVRQASLERPRRARSSASRRSRGTASGSCFAPWPAGCTRCAAGSRWPGPVALHPRGPHHRGADSRADASPRTWCSARGRRSRGSGAAAVDWRGAAGADGGAARGVRGVAPRARRAGGGAERRQPAEGRGGTGAGPAARGSWWRRIRPAGSTSARRRRSTRGCAPRRAGGAAVLVYSSDLDEVLALAARVLVVARGTLIEVPRRRRPVREVGALMLGR